MKGSLWAGSTSTSSGTVSRIRSIDLSQPCSGSASGSVGNTDTLDEIFGSTWSPEISSFSSGHHRQACSGECPVPTTTRQSCSPMRRVSPSRSRRKLSGKA